MNNKQTQALKKSAGLVRLEAVIQDITSGLPALLTLKEAAEALAISPRTLERRVLDGEVAVFRTRLGRGGKILVPRTEIVMLLRQMAG